MAEAQKAAAKADEKDAKAADKEAKATEEQEDLTEDQVRAKNAGDVSEAEQAQAALAQEGFTSSEVAFADQVSRSLGVDRSVALALGHSLYIGRNDPGPAVQGVVTKHAGADLGKDADAQASTLGLEDEDVERADAFLNPEPVEEEAEAK
jgi:hypothetical protein